MSLLSDETQPHKSCRILCLLALLSSAYHQHTINVYDLFPRSDKAVALSPSPHLYFSSLHLGYTSASEVPRMMRNHLRGSTELCSVFSFLQKLHLTQSISDSLSHTSFVSTRGQENTTGWVTGSGCLCVRV